MKTMAETLRKILFLLLLVTLLIPFVQNKLHLVEVSPLKGAVQLSPNASFNLDGWFSGEYQAEKEKYLNESFGFRNILVRLNNQLAFNLFNKAKANGVIIGKDNYLYEENYLKAYYGLDFIGADSINHIAERLKFISDTLNKLHKNIIIVFAAGKGSFYPEYFPENYMATKNSTNLDAYLKAVREKGLNYINFNSYFIANKSKSKYILYPKHGIHWSYYGECLAADSIIKYIEKLRNINMPQIYWNTINLEPAREDDRDIGDGMNLLFGFKKDVLAYPQLHFQSDSGKIKPSAIVISDSFFWGMFNFGFFRSFTDSHFWYYNYQIYPEYYQSQLETDNVDLKDEIAKHDIFIIMATEATLPRFGWGFIENTYNMFKGVEPKTKYDKEFNKKVKDLVDYIKTDEKWYENVKHQATERHISIDSSLTLNAIYTLEHPVK
jgi:hypothetical protein